MSFSPHCARASPQAALADALADDSVGWIQVNGTRPFVLTQVRNGQQPDWLGAGTYPWHA
jgi:hypothetical protein